MVRQASVKVRALLEPVVEGLGYECVGIEYLAQGKNSVLRVYIDGPDGVGVDDCGQVSRQISSLLDVEDPIRGQYLLEVSSPGMDRPLFQLEHFERFVGSTVRLKLALAVNGRKNFTGVLESVEGNDVFIEVDGEVFQVPFDDVDQAQLVPQF